MPTKNQKKAVFRVVLTVHIHGAKVPVEYPINYVSKSGCKATAPYYRDELRELVSNLGHSNFRITTAVKQVAI
jgi:hypothetical protein